ncbi:MAG: alpha/beta hydrolase family esterase, partial [Phycicoccus sp.]
VRWGTALLATVVAVTGLSTGCRAPASGRPSADESSVPAPWARSGDVLVPGRFDSGMHAGRTWLTYVPPTLQRRAPVVLVLHGGGGSALSSATDYPLGRWQQVAAGRAGGMVVVYADGLAGPDGRTTWNDCRPDAAERPLDDVAFLVALADRVVARYDADRDQVHVVGVSNGGMMALRLAAERPDVVAGAGVVAASLPVGDCGGPSEPVVVGPQNRDVDAAVLIARALGTTPAT